jgi:FkbM family methyltransferase
MGIAQAKGTMRFFMFNDPALNTFDAELATARNQGQYRIVGQTEVPTDTLASVLQARLPANTRIDFLSIDVEGLDLPVLESNDWNRFRPECVCVEHSLADLLELPTTPLYQLLSPFGYKPFANTGNTLIFLAAGA